jgi:hypothetical protein
MPEIYKTPNSVEGRSEDLLLGDPHYRLHYEHTPEMRKKYQDSMSSVFKLIEKIQPWPDPTKPGRPFAKELRDRLVTILYMKGVLKGKSGSPGEIDDAEQQRVKYFTSLHSPLDEKGIDCFFIVDGRKITIDVSLRDKIKEKLQIRSDVFIKYPDDLEIGDKNWKTIMEGGEIAEDGQKKFVPSFPSRIASLLLSDKPLKMEAPGVMDDMIPLEPKIRDK